MFYLLGRFLRYLFYGIDFVLFTAVLYLLSFVPKRWLPAFYPQLFWLWCRFFVRALGAQLHLLQQNARPIPKQYILVANHPSAFEDIGIPALFPVYSVAKIEVQDWWIVGRIGVAAGTLFVRREERESRRAAFQQIIDELNSGKNIAVYPEGGCKGRRIFETFRYGPFDVSMQTGIPILPVFLHYEAQEDFEWKPHETLMHKIWHYLVTQNKRINYYVIDAIDPEAFDSKEAYMQHVHALYLKWQAKYLD